MKYMEKHPMLMILVGVIGISLSAIFVRFSQAPAAVTAAAADRGLLCLLLRQEDPIPQNTEAPF